MSEHILVYEHWRTQPLSDLVKISDRIFATIDNESTSEKGRCIIVSDSNVDYPEQYVGLSLASDHLRMLPGEGSPFGEELATSKLNYWLKLLPGKEEKQVSERDTEAIS